MRCISLVVTLALLLAPSSALRAQTDAYIVGPRDVLGVTLFNQMDLSGKYTVQADGTFTFPLLGSVKVDGLTVQQVATELKSRLKQGYFRDPQVAVSVDDYRSQHIFVMGQVRQPGSYPWTGGMTLLEALARAGATTTDASPEALIVHAAPGADVAAAAAAGPNAAVLNAPNVVRVNITDIQSGVAPSHVSIEPGDTIFVPRAETVFVSGQVRSPGAYALTRNMTALQAITVAGGITERGATNRLRVLRLVGDERREVKVKLSDILQAGDTLIIPERFF